MMSQVVEGVWIHLGGYGWIRGEFVYRKDAPQAVNQKHIVEWMIAYFIDYLFVISCSNINICLVERNVDFCVKLVIKLSFF